MGIYETGPVLSGAERREDDDATEEWRGETSRPGLAVVKGRKEDGEPRATRRPTPAETPEARAERTKEIKFKILEGAYDSLEAVDELARRILSSGDM